MNGRDAAASAIIRRMEVTIISIGTLSKNPLWNERTPVRTSHATTTLITVDKRKLLVDPSLPAELLDGRLFERTGLRLPAITDVFLTNWRPAHRRSLPALAHAKWWMHELERDAAERALDDSTARPDIDAETKKLINQELELLKKIESAPDELVDGVSIFPLPGYTVGQCGLICSLPTQTLIVAGDAVPTSGHFSAGQVFQEAFDLDQSKASMAEMYEIADLIIPGHDNIFVNPRASGV
jgi:hypothetical protein